MNKNLHLGQGKHNWYWEKEFSDAEEIMRSPRDVYFYAKKWKKWDQDNK